MMSFCLHLTLQLSANHYLEEQVYRGAVISGACTHENLQGIITIYPGQTTEVRNSA